MMSTRMISFRPGSLVRGVSCFLAAAILLAAVRAAADEVADQQALLSAKSPAIVTIKFVMKIKMAGSERETEAEINGAVIDPGGLIICSNMQMGGFMRSFARRQPGFTVTPTDLKVLIGDDNEGIKATLMARDTDLDLAWVQIDDPGDRRFDWIDLSKAVSARIGDPVYSVRRMGKHFDRVAAVVATRIAAHARKPRELLVPQESLRAALGLPVFAPGGGCLGVLITQMPDEDEDTGGFGGFSSRAEMIDGLVLPAAEVIRATERARQSAKEQMSDEDEESAGGDDRDGDDPRDESAAESDKAPPAGKEGGKPAPDDE